jgi:hypothetical protein
VGLANEIQDRLSIQDGKPNSGLAGGLLNTIGIGRGGHGTFMPNSVLPRITE